MTLHPPFEISPSLEPSLRIGGAWLCLSYSPRPGHDGRIRYRWTLLLPGRSDASGDDLQSGCQGGSLQEGFESLLSFLSAAAESYDYNDRTGRPHFEDPDDNENLFPPAVVEWAAAHSDEISLLGLELTETPDLIAA